MSKKRIQLKFSHLIALHNAIYSTTRCVLSQRSDEEPEDTYARIRNDIDYRDEQYMIEIVQTLGKMYEKFQNKELNLPIFERKDKRSEFDNEELFHDTIAINAAFYGIGSLFHSFLRSKDYTLSIEMPQHAEDCNCGDHASVDNQLSDIIKRSSP